MIIMRPLRRGTYRRAALQHRAALWFTKCFPNLVGAALSAKALRNGEAQIMTIAVRLDRAVAHGFAALLLGVSGALSARAPAPPPDAVPSSATAPDATISSAIGPSASYRLGVADKVRIIVYNEETLSGEFTVSDSGSLSLPLIGAVKAADRTPDEVILDIQTRLADGYLISPRVSMDVLTYRPFYILGEVSKPGQYPFSTDLTVMNAIATAEGFTYRANKRRVFIKRAGQTNETEMLLTPDLRIYPGDTVRVGERYF
jgi:polysaccharide export outer membrane protein